MADTATGAKVRHYERFTVSDRIEHWVQVVAFTGLAITGLVQFAAESTFPRFIIATLGGINNTRFIHRSFGVVVLIATAYHLGTAGYRFYVTRVGREMLPGRHDGRAIAHWIMYNLGRRSNPAREGKFTFAEKMEYWSIIWGTILMGVTGLMMWNPVATTRILPGQFIPAAKAAHGGEAILAVLAILVWHTYFVHFRHFNRSMFDGQLSEEEMRHEHLAQLEAIEAGEAGEPIPPDVLRRRRRRFFPVYIAIVVIGTAGVITFLTYQEITIKTVPPPSTSAQVFVPYAPLDDAGPVDASIRAVTP
ncbi:MAG: cytochrome b/b6 domain-containing protein [Actinomycetota bacterium]